MRIDYAIKYKNELNDLFIREFETERCKYYFCNNWIDFNYTPSDDNWSKREYVVLDDDNSIVGYFAYDLYINVKKINHVGVIKFDETKKMPKKLILERLLKDMISWGADIVEFNAIVGGYPNNKYLELVNNNLIIKNGDIKNFAKLNDGKIYDGASYYFNKEHLVEMISKLSEENVYWRS